MNKKYLNFILTFMALLTCLAYAGTPNFIGKPLFAQPGLIDRAAEKVDHAALQFGEKILDKNIQEAYEYLKSLGYLSALAKSDRALAIKAEKEPYNFRYDQRALKYVPWRNSVRYVKESDLFLLNTFGSTEETLALIQEQVTKARLQKIDIPNFQLGSRDGVEISVFGFLYVKDKDKTRSIGSIRRTLRMFYVPTGRLPNGEQDYDLGLVSLRIVYDNFRQGNKDVEVIIDPSPNDEQMDDLIILHRYNQAPSDVYLLGLMHNTKTFSHRYDFKRKYYSYFRDQFLQLLQRVTKYNTFSTNASHEEQVKRLDRGLRY